MNDSGAALGLLARGTTGFDADRLASLHDDQRRVGT